MPEFLEVEPSLEDRWRAVILFGRNVACYKFALGKCLLQLGREGKTSVTLRELAVPFARSGWAHLRACDTQATSQSSRFLEECRKFNSGQVTAEQLAACTTRLGFNNVIDAFHVVNQGEVDVRFFDDARRGTASGIVLTDDL